MHLMTCTSSHLALRLAWQPWVSTCQTNKVVELEKVVLSPSLHQAQRSDELDIHTDDELEILEWDDGDGWCKGRDRVGKEGYFPQSYVQPSSRSPSPPLTPPRGDNNIGLCLHPRLKTPIATAMEMVSPSSAKDTNNNCNGNGKPWIISRQSWKHNCKYSIGCVIAECWEGRSVYNQWLFRISCVPGAFLCVQTLIQHTITMIQ